MENSSLKHKATNGIKWSFIDNIANSGITFLVGVVLARLLSPTEFGILGLIAIFINLANTIIDGGFVTALIRKPDSTNEDYNTVFYCNLAISVFLMIILILFSKRISIFFNQPLLASIMPIMSILLLINAFGIIPRTLLVKKIDFKTQSKVSVIASLGSGIIGIAMALKGYGVWSLVWQQLSRQFLLTFFFWVYVRWIPSFIFSKESFSDLFGFGSKVLAANLVNTLYGNMFLGVIGKVHTAEKLGQYNRADQFNAIFTNNLTNVIQKVSLPLLSEIQNDDEKLSFTFRKIIIYSSIITFALVFGLAAIAKPLIVLLVGEKWLPAVKYLQIMCCYGFMYPIQNVNLNLLNVKKRSDLLLKLEFLKKIVFIAVIVSGIYFDIETMLFAAVVYYLFEFVCNSWYSNKLCGYGTKMQIKDLFPIMILSLGISSLIWTLTLLPLKNLTILLIQLFTATILYIIIYEFWGLKEYKELKSIVNNNTLIKKINNSISTLIMKSKKY